jgi:hypothetical protein
MADSLLSVDPMHRRNIPKAVMGRTGGDELETSALDVRSWMCFGRRQCRTSGLPQIMLLVSPSVMITRPQGPTVSVQHE